MTDALLFKMLLGHLVGDFMTQNLWMALNKQKHAGLGIKTCLIHCALYTLSVCFFMNMWSPVWVAVVFASHFFPDRYGWTEKYLQFIKGRSLTHFMADEENQTYSPYIALRSGFYIFVFTTVDSTIHLVLLYTGLLYYM